MIYISRTKRRTTAANNLAAIHRSDRPALLGRSIAVAAVLTIALHSHATVLGEEGSGWRPRGSRSSQPNSARRAAQERGRPANVEAANRTATTQRRSSPTGVRLAQFEQEAPVTQSPEGNQQLPPTAPGIQPPTTQSVDDVFEDPFGDGGQLPSAQPLVDPFGDEPREQPVPDPALQLEEEFQQPPSDQGLQPMDSQPGIDALPDLEEPLPLPIERPPNRDDDPYSVELTDDLDEHARECRTSLDFLRGKRLRDIELGIKPVGEAGHDYPRSCRLAYGSVPLHEATPERMPKEYLWTASGLCHKPLYFEQRNLERYGHATGCWTQPVLSAAHFFSTLPVLPYRMGLRPPHECVYALGHYRPGNCAPYLIPAVPFTVRAGLMQAGAVTGTAAVLP